MESTRMPIASDLSAIGVKSIITSPKNRSSNILILLHGIGDTAEAFSNLACQMSLPETTCLTLQAPTPLPFDLPGFHWGDDIVFNESTGQLDPDAIFSKSLRLVQQELINKVLIQQCNIPPRNILILGLGQGGILALAITAALSSVELGGTISFGGPLSAESSTTPSKPSQTPVLVLAGSSNTSITRPAFDRIKAALPHTTYQKWQRSGDGMPRNRAEMLPVMKFLANRLHSQAGKPDGSIPMT